MLLQQPIFCFTFSFQDRYIVRLFNRPVSHMRALLAASRELAVDYNTSRDVLYVLYIKRNIF